MDRRRAVTGTAIAAVMLFGAVGAAQAQGAFGELEYVSKFEALSVNDRDSVKRGCPPGTHVLGGGQYLFSGFQTAVLTASAPFDGGDAGKQPDDGWKTTVDGQDGFANELTVYAICSSRQPKYVQRSVRMREEDSRAAHSVCPTNTRVLGGGARLPGPYRSPFVHDSAPFEDDEWEVAAFTFEPGTMVMSAICARTKTDIVSDSGIAPGQSFGEAFPACDEGEPVVGGGFSGRDIGLTGTISAPFDGLDGDSTPDDGWQVEMDNDEGTNRTVFGRAVCLR